jgi:hypothetical protein
MVFKRQIILQFKETKMIQAKCMRKMQLNQKSYFCMPSSGPRGEVWREKMAFLSGTYVRKYGKLKTKLKHVTRLARR